MPKTKSNAKLKNIDIYSNGDTSKKALREAEEFATYAMAENDAINKALETREQASVVFNGIPYTQAYLYNQRKAINYAPPKDPEDDSEVSFGIIHEKIIAFIAVYLKYIYKRNTKVYDEFGLLINGLGQIYDLAIEHSYRLEKFKELIALIYWETFTQGNAFILEDWEVKTMMEKIPMKDGKELDMSKMDYSYEFLDELTYKDGKQYQTRRAVSKLLDGRQVIFANPEIEDVQAQPWICIETEMDRDEAEQQFGTLKRWKDVPKDRANLDELFEQRLTLFSADRLADPSKKVIVHLKMGKIANKFNFAINGVWMLPCDTPMSVFYPRMNYPLTNVPAERLTGSIYCRSIPAKTKFNADFIDWALKGLAYKFEQGKTPAILTSGRYTLTRDMFRGGQVTHGVKKSDYEFADPENKGVTTQDVTFVELLKGIVETQTTAILGASDTSSNPTAEEIATLDQNQKEKLGYLLDGLTNGFTSMFQRRSETVESKYTIKQRESMVDGKLVNVYQNFTVSISGTDHVVSFDDSLNNPEFDQKASDEALFQKTLADRKSGRNAHYYLANPILLREGKTFVDCEVVAEKKKDAALEMIAMWNEFNQLVTTFQGQVNMDELKKEYLQVSNKPDSIFLSPEQLQQNQANEQGAPAPELTVPAKKVKNAMLGR